jgi:hypothetical protein
MNTMSPRPVRNASWAGAILGAAIGGVCLLVELRAFGTVVMLAAVPTGAVLGWIEGKRVGRTGRLAGSVVRMSVLAVLLGDFLVSFAFAGGDVTALPGVIVLAFIGLLYFGLPALVLTAAASGVWAVTFRWWLGRVHRA